MSAYEVGQALVYVPSEKRRGGPEPVVVTKVARKWVSFKGEGRYPRENRFEKDTGYVDGGGYASPGRIFPSMEAHQAELDREQALAELRAAMDWRTSRVPKDISAQRIRLAMGLLQVGGDTDPLKVMTDLADRLPNNEASHYLRDEAQALRRLLGRA